MPQVPRDDYRRWIPGVGEQRDRRNPGQRPARFLAWAVGGPICRFFVNTAERVHRLPQVVKAMQAVMAEFGVQRVGAAPR